MFNYWSIFGQFLVTFFQLIFCTISFFQIFDQLLVHFWFNFWSIFVQFYLFKKSFLINFWSIFGFILVIFGSIFAHFLYDFIYLNFWSILGQFWFILWIYYFILYHFMVISDNWIQSLKHPADTDDNESNATTTTATTNSNNYNTTIRPTSLSHIQIWMFFVLQNNSSC